MFFSLKCLCKDRATSSHVYVLGVSMVPLFTNLLLDLGNVHLLNVEDKAHKSSLTPPYVFIAVSVQRQDNDRWCTCVSIVLLFTNLLLDLGNVLTVCYVLFPFYFSNYRVIIMWFVCRCYWRISRRSYWRISWRYNYFDG